MGSFSRKIKRNQEKQAKKQLKKITSSYLELPEQCMACDKPFDKTSKDHATTWSIVVRRAEGKQNLYCPECWNGAKKLLAEIQEDIAKQEPK